MRVKVCTVRVMRGGCANHTQIKRRKFIWSVCRFYHLGLGVSKRWINCASRAARLEERERDAGLFGKSVYTRTSHTAQGSFGESQVGQTIYLICSFIPESVGEREESSRFLERKKPFFSEKVTCEQTSLFTLGQVQFNRRWERYNKLIQWCYSYFGKILIDIN